MSPRVRKLALTAHLTLSVGWIGAVVVYLALGVTAVAGRDGHTIRSAWIAMEASGWFVIVPFALGSLLTGVVMALGTRWGLFRHYWVLFSFALTVFAVIVLLLHMPTVSMLADVARNADLDVLRTLGGDLGHPAIGLVVLIAVQVMNIYKPSGLTRYGRRARDKTRQGDPPTRTRPQGETRK